MFDRDDLEFLVVRNDEEQYSLWPVGRSLPPGWTPVGVRGDRSVCLDHISKQWTDMRPKSLRETSVR